MTVDPRLYGLMAEFDGPETLVGGARRAHDAGFRAIDAFSPFPVEGLADAIGFRQNRLPLIVLCGGCVGAICGFAMQYFGAVIDYPINVGGRPLASWPAFGIVAFELCILCAALSAVFGMLVANGLPMPYHPVFNVAAFGLASRDRFFLLIESSDPSFGYEETAAFLRDLGALKVHEVER
jgi:hypothetical protein